MGEGSGRGSGRVRLFVGNRGSGRVGSTFRRVGSGRVQEKWPVDNSDPMYYPEKMKSLRKPCAVDRASPSYICSDCSSS